VGFIVGFDSYNNTTTAVMSKVHVAYGQVPNTTDNNNVEFFNVAGSSFHSPDMNTTLPFQGTTYKHVEVTAQVDPAAPANWIVKITIDGNLICNQSFAPSGTAAAMTVGYFGFSASTGGNRSRHSIKNVKVYIDKVALNQATVTDTFCPNPSTGQGTVNLTNYQSQFVTNPANYTFSYSVSGTPITNPTNYQFNANTTVSVLIKDNSGILCDNPDGKIQLNLSPFTATPATLTACNNNNVGSATFNLTQANVNEPAGSTKKYYKTLNDLNAGTNEITNFTNYVSPAGIVYVKDYISTSSTVYVRITNLAGCFVIVKITLKVLSPIYSSVLMDKIICIDDTTTLDAGPGFDAYTWSTGESTQSIQNVSPGLYWVQLKSGRCTTMQMVKVTPSPQPVIASIDITNNTITVNVKGGKGPYQYSLDGVNWQDSNIFTGLARGEVVVYVKDAYDCTPIHVQITVPNLINAITPNGDNKNDYIDYSALAYKKNLVFTIYDRYGNKLYEADKLRNYKWDGTSSGKKVITGTYWYTINWNENDKNNTQTTYKGWVLVKNRE